MKYTQAKQSFNIYDFRTALLVTTPSVSITRKDWCCCAKTHMESFSCLSQKPGSPKLCSEGRMGHFIAIEFVFFFFSFLSPPPHPPFFSPVVIVVFMEEKREKKSFQMKICVSVMEMACRQQLPSPTWLSNNPGPSSTVSCMGGREGGLKWAVEAVKA